MKNRIQKMSAYRPSIFQGRLEFAAVRNGLSESGFTLTSQHSAERAVLSTLIVVLALLALLYIYFVGSSIFNIMARKEANAERNMLATDVSQLEREYFAEGNAISPRDAENYGLAPLASTAYVYRPGNLSAADSALKDAVPAGQSLNGNTVTMRGNEI